MLCPQQRPRPHASGRAARGGWRGRGPGSEGGGPGGVHSVRGGRGPLSVWGRGRYVDNFVFVFNLFSMFVI